MTKRAIRKFEMLQRFTEKNSPKVMQKLANAGLNPDSPVVASAAKYYVALTKLSEE